jgi:uncharacterized membrane protein YccC
MSAAGAPPPDPRAATAAALRDALAAALCLLLVEWWQLSQANLAVWTTHMVLAQYTFTAFQKGVERVVGRGVGILLGWAILTLVPNVVLVRLLLEAILLFPLFYVYFSGRLAYTFLNAGLYLAVIAQVGQSEPFTVVTLGKELFLALLVGVIVADLVTWLTAGESDLRIQPGGSPLLPVRADWVNHALMLIVAVLLTRAACSWLALPTSKAIVSVMLLTVTPDLQSSLRKGELRLVGALLATLWATGGYLLLGQSPHFAVLVMVLFLGVFVAAYLSRMGGTYSYAGLQMGLVLPLILVIPPPEYGSFTGAMQRLEGIAVAISASLVVGALWPWSTPTPTPTPVAAQETQGSQP